MTKVITENAAGGCGTHAGYQRHRRAGQAACDECKAANTTYNANHRAASLRRRSIERRWQRAYQRALVRLGQMNPGLLRALIAEELYREEKGDR